MEFGWEIFYFQSFFVLQRNTNYFNDLFGTKPNGSTNSDGHIFMKIWGNGTNFCNGQGGRTVGSVCQYYCGVENNSIRVIIIINFSFLLWGQISGQCGRVNGIIFKCCRQVLLVRSSATRCAAHASGGQQENYCSCRWCAGGMQPDSVGKERIF